MENEVEKCCGSCVHFLYECTDGDGVCEVKDCVMFCDNGEDCEDWEDDIKQV